MQRKMCRGASGSEPLPKRCAGDGGEIGLGREGLVGSRVAVNCIVMAAYRADRVAAQGEPLGGAANTLPAPSGNVLVYVVDDEPLVGEVFEAILLLAKFEVRVFQDPALALQSVVEARARPQLLITDYAMGLMNGGELIQACRMVRPDLKTILVSSSVGANAAGTCPVEPDRFLVKPFQARTLLDTVREVLAGCDAV